MAGSGITSRRWGWAIGALATLAGGAVYLAGWIDRLDGYNLDLHFRNFNSLQADPRIVLIDIDDSTLQATPDWPWPRQVFADLVRTIDEFEPKSIALDIVFDLPSRSTNPEAEVESKRNDEALALALARGGNVFLAMFAGINPPTSARAPQCENYRVSAREFLRQTPTGTWEDWVRAALPGQPVDFISPERESILAGFRQALAHRSVESRLASVEDPGQSIYPTTASLTMPLEIFAEAARGVGLVSFHRIRSTELLRSLPLVVAAEDMRLPQLGATVGLDALGVSPDQIELDGHSWLFGRGESRRLIPFDKNGNSLVNWHAPPTEDWRGSFVHLPAALLLELSENRRAITENGARCNIAFAELVRIRHAHTPAMYNEYVAKVNARIHSEQGDPRDEHIAYAVPDPEIERMEQETTEWLRRAWGLWADGTPRNASEAAERDWIKQLYDRFGEGQYAALLDAANRKLEARNAELIAELGPILKDKICLVGYTATAMADMVPTPVDPAMPGVMVHANVVNMFLQNRFASAAEPFVNVFWMLVCGAVTTFAAVRGRTRVSVIVLLLLVVALLGGGAAMFYQSTYHIASLASVMCVLLTWGCVTVYRQSTDERSRRKLQRALSQYTSPAVATRIAEQARGDTLAPQTARVTCFFSDLSGFTALSERLGPQRTREALDPYLREVSAVIMAQQGMVNKFIGDGVFAFFNAPILPCPNHAAAACEAALLAAKCVKGGSLSVRIGLSTGDAFVGDYGSDQKLDYTCIGDTVNVGQRLERANKFFATTILVDDSTRQTAGDGFAFRSLGRIAVPGRSGAVSACELVGRAGEVSAEVQARMASFEEAIRCFQTCQWDSCLSLLSKQIQSDHAARRYEQAAKRFQGTAPPADWNGAINPSDF